MEVNQGGEEGWTAEAEGCTKLHENDFMSSGSNEHVGVEVEVTLWTLTNANRNEKHNGCALQVCLGAETCATFPERSPGCTSGAITFPHLQLGKKREMSSFWLL